jgi:hypothetical protein
MTDSTPLKPGLSAEKPRPSGVSKLAAGKATKKLPWLDGNLSSPTQNVPSTTEVSTTEVATTTPGMYPHITRKRIHTGQPPPTLPFKHASAPKVNSKIRIVGSTPTLCRPDANEAPERPLSVGTSPSHISQNRSSQISNRISRHSLSSSLRGGGAVNSLPTTSKDTKPLVDGDIQDPPLVTPSPSVHSFSGNNAAPAPATAQAERHIIPDSVSRPVQREVRVLSPPIIVKSAQLSPTVPVPKRNPFHNANNKRRLSNAIEGLEDMVREAVEIADNTADATQVKEVYDIIEDATIALQEASVNPTQRLMITALPLDISSSSEEVSDSSISSECSRHGHITSPTRVKTNIVPDVNGNTGSTSTDWAYNNLKKPRREPSPASSASPSSADRYERGRSKFSTQSDLLLPLAQAQTANREHVDFILRPARRQRPSRGRSRHRKDGEHHRHRNFRRSHDDYSRPQHHKCRSDSYSRSSSSINEKQDPYVLQDGQGRNRYRQEVDMHGHTHHHTIGLHRPHRRQPIARNWSTGKKRITATIACINTALVGIIVGIYVRMARASAGSMLMRTGW